MAYTHFLAAFFSVALCGCGILRAKYSVSRVGIAGRIIDAESGEPISNALVIAYYWNYIQARNPEFRFTRSSGDGGFCIPDEYEDAEEVWYYWRHWRNCNIDEDKNPLAYRREYFSAFFVSAEGYPIADCTKFLHTKFLHTRPFSEGGVALSYDLSDVDFVHSVVRTMCDSIKRRPDLYNPMEHLQRHASVRREIKISRNPKSLKDGFYELQ